jgi:hypothetical protein
VGGSISVVRHAVAAAQPARKLPPKLNCNVPPLVTMGASTEVQDVQMRLAAITEFTCETVDAIYATRP